MIDVADSSLETDVRRRFPEVIRAHLPLDAHFVGPAPVEFADLEFRLSGGGLTKTVWVQVKAQSIRPSTLETLAAQAREVSTTDPSHMYLLLTPSLDGKMRKHLRDLDLNHADLSGTLYINEPGLVVRIDGPEPSLPRRSVPTPCNPFADKASLILRAMMRTPSRGWGVREIADEVGISVGLASMTTEEIVRRGYAEVTEGKVSLRDSGSALQDWVSVPRWRYNKVLSYQVPFEPEEILEAAAPAVVNAIPAPTALTQLAGLDLYASHVRGHGQVHLYLSGEAIPAARAAVEARVHGTPVRDGGNFHLVQPSAKTSTLFGLREIKGLPVVSPVQLFLDLSQYPVRGPEAATMLLRTVLAEELELDRRQVQKVSSVLE